MAEEGGGVGGTGRPLYLFGAGRCGIFLLEKVFGKEYRQAVKGFIDNNAALWGKKVAGVPVVGIETAARDNPEALILIDVVDMNIAREMTDQCEKAGLEAIDFSGIRGVPYLPVGVYEHCERLLDSPFAIQSADLFADARSREIYGEELLHRLRYEHYFYPDFVPAR